MVTIKRNKEDNNHIWDQRPEFIVKQIDEKFNVQSKYLETEWSHFSGDEFYHMCMTNDHSILEKKVKENPNQQSFTILDVGTSSGKLLYSFKDYILSSDKSEIFSNRSFEIIGLTAENCNTTYSTEANVSLKYICKFKSENIINEFEAMGINLNSQVDLIYSRYTLKHFKEPAGVVAQLYYMLKPITGYLFMDDFTIKYNKNSAIDTAIDPMRVFTKDSARMALHSNNVETLLLNLKANFLICPISDFIPVKTMHKSTVCNHFVIKKNSLDFEPPEYSYNEKSEEINIQNTFSEKLPKVGYDKTFDSRVTSLVGNGYFYAGLGGKEIYDDIKETFTCRRNEHWSNGKPWSFGAKDGSCIVDIYNDSEL